MTIVSAIQMTSTPDLQHNLAQAAILLAQAAGKGAQLAVLPEMFPQMGANNAEKITLAEEFGQGLIQDFIAEQARKNQLWIVGGTIPLITAGERVRAACLVYDADGVMRGRYDKIHLFDVIITKGQEEHRESAQIEPGEEVIVIDTPFGKLGLAICYDLRFPELFRALLDKGAEIIAVPAAFTEKTGRAHFEILSRCRALENFCYGIYACQTGIHSPTRTTHGHSMIVDPWGNILSQMTGDIGSISANVNIAHLHQLRRDFPAVDHRVTKQCFT